MDKTNATPTLSFFTSPFDHHKGMWTGYLITVNNIKNSNDIFRFFWGSKSVDLIDKKNKINAIFYIIKIIDIRNDFKILQISILGVGIFLCFFFSFFSKF